MKRRKDLGMKVGGAGRGVSAAAGKIKIIFMKPHTSSFTSSILSDASLFRYPDKIHSQLSLPKISPTAWTLFFYDEGCSRPVGR